MNPAVCISTLWHNMSDGGGGSSADYSGGRHQSWQDWAAERPAPHPPPALPAGRQKMWVRPEVLRRDQIDHHHPLPPLHCLTGPVPHNLYLQACWVVDTHWALALLLISQPLRFYDFFFYLQLLSQILKSLFWCQGRQLHWIQSV